MGPARDIMHLGVGIISAADRATHLSEQQVSQLASAVYSAPPTS